MIPATPFLVNDPYEYLVGLGNYHQSEFIPGAVPPVNNSPQKPPLGLFTERISGSSFVAPREHSYQTFLYRVSPSIIHDNFQPLEVTGGFGPVSQTRIENVTPNSYQWDSLPVPEEANWINGQQIIGRNGDPQRKDGTALWIFSITQDMPERQAFSSLDGDVLIIPQSGTLDIQTELGRLLVRQNEVAVVPRNVRYRVSLPEGKPCRGYICELYQGHFRLPDLGIIGSTGLANIRDFQIPKAFVNKEIESHVQQQQENQTGPALTPPKEEWSIVTRLVGKLWHCKQDHTPFDVVGWHGTSYPYKYDLGRFCAMGNIVFDEHDPSLFTVLTARNHGAEPSTSVVDFAIIPPRWMAARDSLWIPYFHRNTMQEFFAPIVSLQDPTHPLNGETNGFRPFAGGLHGSMSTHGPSARDLEAAREQDVSTPAMVNNDGLTIFLLETDRPLMMSDWAFKYTAFNVVKEFGKL